MQQGPSLGVGKDKGKIPEIVSFNLTQSKSPEKSLNEELSISGEPMKMSVGDCFDDIK